MKKFIILLSVIAVGMVKLLAQPSTDMPFDVPKWESNIVVDGIPDDDVWSMAPIHVNTHWAGGITDDNPPDPADFSASWQLVWNETGLLLFVHVVDDIWNPYPHEGNTYEYDNVAIFLYFGDDFGPDAEVTEVYEDEYYSMIRMLLDSEDEIYHDGRALGEWGSFPLGKAPQGLEFAVKRSIPGDWQLEAIIPWELLVTKFSIEEGMSFGWEIQVEDADEDWRDAISLWVGDTGTDLAWNDKSYLSTATLTAPNFAEDEPTLRPIYDNEVIEHEEILDLGYCEPVDTFGFDLVVKNMGKEALEISSVSIEGTGYSLLNSIKSSLETFGTDKLQCRFICNEVGKYPGTLSIVSNDAKQGKYSIPLTIESVNPTAGPGIEVFYQGEPMAPDSQIDFGDAFIDSARFARELVIKNRGLQDLYFSKVYISKGSAGYHLQNAPSLLRFGESKLLKVYFDPKSVTEVGPVEGNLQIVCNDPENGIIDIPLDVFAIRSGPELVVTQKGSYQPGEDFYQFGDCPVGVEKAKRFMLTNLGSQPVNDILIVMEGEDFEVVTVGNFPIGLRDTVYVDVTYTPAANKQSEADIFLSYDSWNGIPYVIQTRGYGIEATEHPTARYLIGNKTMNSRMDTLNFGWVSSRNGVYQLNINVINYGIEPLEIETELQSEAFSIRALSANLNDTWTLNFNEDKMLFITFMPPETREYLDELTFYTNDPNNPTFVIPLMGAGVNDSPTVQMYTGGTFLKSGVDTLDFGVIKQRGETCTKSIMVKNLGLDYLTSLACEIQGEGFRIIEPYFPVLAFNQMLNYQIEFSPEKKGIYEGVLEMESNDPVNPSFKINLHGVADLVDHISTNAMDDLEIFPNPVKDVLFIQPQSHAAYEVELYTTSGVRVYEKTFTGKVWIDIPGFESGVYIMRVTTESGIGMRKIVKE